MTGWFILPGMLTMYVTPFTLLLYSDLLIESKTYGKRHLQSGQLASLYSRRDGRINWGLWKLLWNALLLYLRRSGGPFLRLHGEVVQAEEHTIWENTSLQLSGRWALSRSLDLGTPHFCGMSPRRPYWGQR